MGPWSHRIRVLVRRDGVLEFPLWLSRLRTQCCLSEDMGLIPGLAQWVKDPGIAVNCGVGHRCSLNWCCRGYGIGFSCNFDLTPGLGIYVCCWCGPKKERKRERERYQRANFLLPSSLPPSLSYALSLQRRSYVCTRWRPPTSLKKRPQNETYLACTLIWTCRPPKPWEINS